MVEPYVKGGRPASEPDFYVIQIKGHLTAQWSEWLAGMKITLTESGDTLLSGFVADQAALHGLLAIFRDLNLPLIAVNRVPPGSLSKGNDESSA